MAKAKARKGAASRRGTSTAKTAQGSARKSASKPTRKPATRAAGARQVRKTGAKPAKKAQPGRRRKPAAGRRGTAKTAARAAARRNPQPGGTRARTAGKKARPRIGTAKGGPKRAAPLANPRGSSGPGTNPWPTKASTGTGSGTGVSRSPYIERERKRLRETEEEVPTPPSSLDLDRSASAVRTGRQELREALHEHTETSPALTAGDVDADWQGAYSVGDEAAGGDNPTPDQQRVDDIGKALGVEYEDDEELKGVDKIDGRDRKRWELNPASAEDYKERQK